MPGLGLPLSRKGHVVDSSTIKFMKMDHPNDVSFFLRSLKRILTSGIKDVSIDLTAVNRVFPNACVPISAMLDHYREQGISFNFVHGEGWSGRVRLEHPLLASPANLDQAGDVLSKIWKFTDEVMVGQLVTRALKRVAERVECSAGVLEAFEWCLNEVLDNVLQHSQDSQAHVGFVMVQVHQEKKRFAVCVADTGLGIYGTLRNSKYKPSRAVDAITLAVKEGVTRDPNIGQGNGLWGLYEMVKSNQGTLSITSGEGALFLRDREVTTFDNLPIVGSVNRGTIVDFQIHTGRSIDIASALRGHRPVNLATENLEVMDGEYMIIVREHAHGTGTRRSGEQIRNFVINNLADGASRVVLDFSGIAVISSSFADEFVGKLVSRFGFFGFQSRVKLSGMNETVQGIVHRSVAQRMMEDIQRPVS